MVTLKHFLDLDQVDPKTLRQILDHGKAMKKARSNGGRDKPLGGETLSMNFAKPPKRTPVRIRRRLRAAAGPATQLGPPHPQLPRGGARPAPPRRRRPYVASCL